MTLKESKKLECNYEWVSDHWRYWAGNLCDVMEAELQDRRKEQFVGKVVSQEALTANYKKGDEVFILWIYDFFSKRRETAPCVNFVTRTLNKLDL